MNKSLFKSILPLVLLLFLLISPALIKAQPPCGRPPCGNGGGGGPGGGNGGKPCAIPPCIPIDNGMGFLLIGGAVLGFYYFRNGIKS